MVEFEQDTYLERKDILQVVRKFWHQLPDKRSLIHGFRWLDSMEEAAIDEFHGGLLEIPAQVAETIETL